jgi:hypothetical protein
MLLDGLVSAIRKGDSGSLVLWGELGSAGWCHVIEGGVMGADATGPGVVEDPGIRPGVHGRDKRAQARR